MLFPSFFAQNLLHFSFIIIAFATSNHPFKPMTTQANKNNRRLLQDPTRLEGMAVWLLCPWRSPPIANRTPRLRQGVPEGYGMVYPSGTILWTLKILGRFLSLA